MTTRVIEITVSLGLVGCKRTTTIEVDEDATEDEIEELARDAMLDGLIEWSWRPVDRASRRSRT
jgi:hypothetical protein